jgi:polyhydroxyalkanoate synthesis regulator phasin
MIEDLDCLMDRLYRQEQAFRVTRRCWYNEHFYGRENNRVTDTTSKLLAARAVISELRAEIERLQLRVKFLEDELKCPAALERLRQTVNDQAQEIERLTRE